MQGEWKTNYNKGSMKFIQNSWKIIFNITKQIQKLERLVYL